MKKGDKRRFNKGLKGISGRKKLPDVERKDQLVGSYYSPKEIESAGGTKKVRELQREAVYAWLARLKKETLKK